MYAGAKTVADMLKPTEITKIGEIIPDFDMNIENIERIFFLLTFQTGQTLRIWVYVRENEVVIRYPRKADKHKDKAEFFDKLRELDIKEWEWFSHFKTTGNYIEELLIWKMSIQYNDNVNIDLGLDEDDPVHIYGECDCPANFGEFLRLVGFDISSITDESGNVVYDYAALMRSLGDDIAE